MNYLRIISGFLFGGSHAFQLFNVALQKDQDIFNQIILYGLFQYGRSTMPVKFIPTTIFYVDALTAVFQVLFLPVTSEVVSTDRTFNQ